MKTIQEKLVDSITRAIRKHRATITYCEVIGILEIIKSDIIQDAREEQ